MRRNIGVAEPEPADGQETERDERGVEYERERQGEVSEQRKIKKIRRALVLLGFSLPSRLQYAQGVQAIGCPIYGMMSLLSLPALCAAHALIASIPLDEFLVFLDLACRRHRHRRKGLLVAVEPQQRPQQQALFVLDDP